MLKHFTNVVVLQVTQIQTAGKYINFFIYLKVLFLCDGGFCTQVYRCSHVNGSSFTFIENVQISFKFLTFVEILRKLCNYKNGHNRKAVTEL